MFASLDGSSFFIVIKSSFSLFGISFSLGAIVIILGFSSCVSGSILVSELFSSSSV